MPALPEAATREARLVRRAWARGLAAPPRRSVWQWADAERVLGSDESPFPGRWRTDRMPLLREPMEVMSLHHPCRQVDLKFSAQTGKTMCGLNLFGQVACEQPEKILWVSPSNDEAKSFNAEKLDPMINNTPAIQRRVREVISRDEAGSTVMRKRFTGGSLELVGANSSKGLQMRTVRVLILDEVSEYPFDVDGRGDPVDMAEARTIAYTGREKRIAVSTPGLKGSCRITARYEAGSAAQYHVPCPHCQAMQPLDFANLHWPEGQPEKAVYHCAECGAAIEHRHKAWMLDNGRWVHRRPELIVVHASYAANSLYSPFVPWSEVARQDEKSRDDPVKRKTFVQQWLGEAYEPRYDVPSHETLFLRREERPPRRIPPGVLFLVGAADVQGGHIEWGVYGFDRHFGQWWIDGGIIIGDPALNDVWHELDDVTRRTYPDAWGRQWSLQSFGCDSGYLPQRVYAWARRNAHRAEPKMFALDGRAKWGLAPIGQPSKMDVDYAGAKVGEVLLWPVGTWDLKSELASALRLTEMGPDGTGTWPKGAMRFTTTQTAEFFLEMTAEECKEIQPRGGLIRREWQRIRKKNEQWDIAVYARALARHETAAFREADWDALTAERMGEPEAAQADLADLWAPGLREEVVAARENAAIEQQVEQQQEPPPSGGWGASPGGWGGFQGW